MHKTINKTLVSLMLCAFLSAAWGTPHALAAGQKQQKNDVSKYETSSRIEHTRMDERRAQVDERLKRANERLHERIRALENRICRSYAQFERFGVTVPLPTFCRGSGSGSAPQLIMTVTPSSVVAGGTAQLTWTSEHASSCTASNGWSGTRPTSGTEQVAPATTTTYTLTCVGPHGTIEKSAILSVEKNGLPTPTISLNAAPSSVVSGASTTLTWVSTHAATCTASGGWSGPRATSGSEVVTPTATTTYELACSNATGTATTSVEVGFMEAVSVPTASLVAEPALVTFGGTSTLNWDSQHATGCMASGAADWSGPRAATGSALVTVFATTTYVVECGDGVSSSTASATVSVVPVAVSLPTVTLSADPVLVEAGSSTTLTWVSTHAATCTASGGWSGPRATSGSEVVTPTATTTYELACSNATGTATTSVEVGFMEAVSVPTVSLTAASTQVTEGSTTTLTWESTHATACMASGAGDFTGDRALAGQVEVTVSALTTYTITCGNGTATATDSVTVTVTLPEGTVPTVNLSALPSSVASGATSTLAWNTSGADSCEALLGWTGTRATSGEEIVSVTGTTTYELRCENAYGTTTSSVEVVVVAEADPVSTMLISEFVFNPAGTEPGNEWVELYNGSTGPIDLMHWTLADASSSDLIATSSKVIPAGGYVVITSSTTLAQTLIAGGVDAIAATSSIGQNGLSNTGDALFLRDPAGTLVDAVSYGTNTMAFSPALSIAGMAEGASYARVPVTVDTDTAADWVILTVPTPGS